MYKSQCITVIYLVEQTQLLEVFCDFREINLKEKGVDISCCIELISDMSKIWAFY